MRSAGIYNSANPFGIPYFVSWNVEGLTIGPTTPLVFQLPTVGQNWDFLQILPGTCILNFTLPPISNQVYNSICTLRIYDQGLAQQGYQSQNYTPNGPPIHSQQFGTGVQIQWGRGLYIALEIFTPFAVAIQPGSIVETTIVPGKFVQQPGNIRAGGMHQPGLVAGNVNPVDHV